MDRSTEISNLENALHGKPFDALVVQEEKPTDIEHKPLARKDRLTTRKDRLSSTPVIEVAKIPSKESKKYTTPDEVFQYIKKLAAESGEKFTGLLFDLREPGSVDEAAYHVSRYSKLTQKEKDNILSILQNPTDRITQKKEKLQTSPEVVQNPEEIKADLEESRSVYAKQVALYVQGIKSTEAQYSKIMADFGVERPLPPLNMPAELIRAQKDYFETRRKAKGNADLSFDVNEFDLLRKAIYESAFARTQRVVAQALKNWNTVAVADEGELLDALLVTRETSSPKTEIVSELVASKEVFDKSVNVPGRIIFPAAYKDHKLEVVRDTVEGEIRVTVLLDGREIGNGKIVDSGPEVKVLPQYEPSFLRTESEESKAFKSALPIIRSLKV